MPHLFCTVQRLSLRDGTLIREGQDFVVSPDDAKQYLLGGIARRGDDNHSIEEYIEEVGDQHGDIGTTTEEIGNPYGDTSYPEAPAGETRDMKINQNAIEFSTKSKRRR